MGLLMGGRSLIDSRSRKKSSSFLDPIETLRWTFTTAAGEAPPCTAETREATVADLQL
jgi:hypothetical protein